MAYDTTRIVHTNERQQTNTKMTRISVRLDDELKEEFEQYCNHNGKSMSGVIKEDIRDRIGTSNTGPLPAEPELAKAYRHIHDIQSDDGRVPVSDAEPALANILNLPSKTVRRRILTHFRR